jgi:UDP-glucose-4-epimerase GalE
MTLSIPKRIGITGASGFIGGALAIEFKKRGYHVVGIDLVRRTHLKKYFDDFFQQDFEHIPTFKSPAWDNCDVIIHCAGTSLVGPSICHPINYYNNNVAKTIKLLDWCVLHKKHFLFSSSASVYKTKNSPLYEEDEKQPLSPYAKSKWMIEQIVGDFSAAHNLPATVFRYFNACGAVGSKHGQQPKASHIFPRLMEATREFDLYGDDFKTPDGTCIRDYIHVSDIADAHVKAVERSVYGVYNLGSNNGFSNKQIIDAVNKKLIVNVLGRRLGDTDCLVADNTSARYMLGWVPLSTLSDIVKDLNEWYGSDNFKGK